MADEKPNGWCPYHGAVFVPAGTNVCWNLRPDPDTHGRERIIHCPLLAIGPGADAAMALLAENARLRAAIEPAYLEGWTDFHENVVATGEWENAGRRRDFWETSAAKSASEASRSNCVLQSAAL